MPSDFPEDARLSRERACLARARSGDREAFSLLYRAFAPRLFERVLLPKLGERQAAEDALAETFRSLLEQLPNLDCETQGLWPWLCRVASNKATDVFRRYQRARRAVANCERLLVPLLGSVESEQNPDRARLAQAVTRLLEALAPRQRQAIELRFFEECSRQECAARMQLKLGTFDVLLLRSLRAFRAQWELQFTPSVRGLP
jgi:RNA polymerase sigma-70 factor (ECF subfamily)